MVTIANSTVAGNTDPAGGGGILNRGTLRLISSIVGDNQVTNDPANGPDILATGGALTALSSLVERPEGHAIADGVNGSIVGEDPALAPLADNGGPTFTQALLPGSPAVNAGSNPAALTFDQRGDGFLRNVGGRADMGAYEVQ